MSAFVVALTGGVASGKSAVEQRFAALGVGVYDADRAAREVIEPGTDGLEAIVEAFGPDVLDPSGRLDRPAMRQRIFADRDARHVLESIIHPRVRQSLRTYADRDQGSYCMLSIPLLVENLAHYRWVNRVLCVDVPEAIQLDRLILRDGIDPDLARRMLASQAARADRLAIADDVLDNSGPIEGLDTAIATLHARYLALAGATGH